LADSASFSEGATRAPSIETDDLDHHRFRRLNAREELERAVRPHAAGADVAVLGVRDADERCGKSRLP
jgi:hypothetical protein